jgi:hypothetical protein
MTEQCLHHGEIDAGLGQGGRSRTCAAARAGARPRSRRARGGNGRSSAARQRSAAGPGSVPWRPGTACRCPTRAARPAGRPGSPRQRRRPTGPAVTGFPCRSPSATGRRYQRRRRPCRAPQPSAIRNRASALRSLGPARCGSSPATQPPPAATAPSAGTWVPAAAAMTGSSDGGPYAPHSRALAADPPAGLPALRDRAHGLRVAHRREREQPRDRREPAIDRRRRLLIHPAPRQQDDVRARTARQPGLTAGPQEPQQRLRRHPGKQQVLGSQPPAERQKVIAIGTHRLRRVVPVSQIRQVLIRTRQATATGIPSSASSRTSGNAISGGRSPARSTRQRA